MGVGGVFGGNEPISVLLVGGEPGIAAVASEVLAAHPSIETEVVATPAEAFARIDFSNVDCLVSEQAFSNTTGIDFLRDVRDSHPNLPFILFTRHGSEAVASDAISAGVTDYLRNDLSAETFDVLAHRIVEAVSAARTSRTRDQLFQWYEAIVEESHVGLYVVRNGRIVFANDYLLTLLGYELTDVIGHRIVDFVAEHDRQVVEERVAPQTDGGVESMTYTVDIINEHGHPVTLELTSRRVTVGDETVNVGAATDVTARLASEREIRRSERITRQVISSLPDMVFLSEPDVFDIVYINDTFKEVWGRPKWTLYEDPTSFFELVHVDDRARLKQGVEKVFQDVADGTAEERYEFEFRFTPEGSETVRWATARAVPLYDEDGSITNILGVMTDLTERIRREQELSQQNARLEAFARVLSHDIRGPLAVAQGRLDLAQETGDQSHLDYVEQSQRRIAEVIEDVLSLACDDGAVVDRSPVELAEAAASAWNLCGADTTHARVEIGDLPTVQANQSQVKRLFQNLFRNSLEHAGAPRDTDLVIRVGSLPSGRGFFVEDNGQGISESIRDVLFEQGTSTKTEEGHGLGLNIVKKIVHTHGWLIRPAESDSGSARFEILFDTVGDGAAIN
ncbi:PAS domain S-box protein [Haloferax sp. DFSO52]|uniref:PAS domain S-box protein n=1 Tax=Haloferax sp. DFSO52 TaxID=3388505 RepID=UPI003A87CFE2